MFLDVMFIVQLRCTVSLFFNYSVCCQNFKISCIYNKGFSSKQEWPYESLIKMHVYDFTPAFIKVYNFFTVEGRSVP